MNNPRKRIGSIFVTITITALLTAIMALSISSQQSSVKRGQLDLSGYDFEKQGIISLDGEWEFYPGAFSMPPQPATGQLQDSTDNFIKVPGTWNRYQANGELFDGFGAATYRMTVTGVEPNKSLSLKIPPQSTAYRLYIDDQLVAQNGQISLQKAGFVPEYRPQKVNFTSTASHFTITMHIANFTYARGGMWYVIQMGTLAQIGSVYKLTAYLDSFLLGNYCIMLLLCIVLFLVGQDRIRYPMLYFALLCLAAAGRVLIYGNYTLIYIISSFRTHVVIDYLTLVWFPVIFILLTNSIYLHLLKKTFIRFIVSLTLIFSIIILTAPISFFTTFTWLLELNVLVMGLIQIAALLLNTGNNSRWIIIFGTICLFFSSIYDILLQNCIIDGLFLLSPLGFYIILLLGAIVLARNYAQAIIKSEKALQELRKSNELEQQTELRLLQSQIKPHFLYNALSAIANVCSKDGSRAEKLILELGQFLQASFDFNACDQMTTLQKELSLIENYISIEKARFVDKIHYLRQIDVPLNIQIPRLIIEPLIENAIRHGITKQKSGGEVWLKITTGNEQIHIEVIDNGVGMDQEKANSLLDDSIKRRGIGIKNIHERLVKLYGSGLTIESTLNVGTRISFTIREEQQCSK
ncbi:MAG: sensor histidine kinase [Syntrophomonas sp.]